MGDWYWIYYAAPMLAAWLVAEVTALMQWNVDDDEDAQTMMEAANTPDAKTLNILYGDTGADDADTSADGESRTA
jgi:hypothetical protein